MNSVIVTLCIASLILMVVFAFLWYFETRRREIIEACLGASLAEVTHLQTVHEQAQHDKRLFGEAMVALTEEKDTLLARNADLSDALQDARAEIKALDMHTVEMPESA